jgi:hypothetical protein
MFITLTSVSKRDRKDTKVSVNINNIILIIEDIYDQFNTTVFFGVNDEFVQFKETREEILRKIENTKL